VRCVSALRVSVYVFKGENRDLTYLRSIVLYLTSLPNRPTSQTGSISFFPFFFLF